MPAASPVVIAHAVPAVTWTAWSFEPGIVSALGAVGLAYAAGVHFAWRAAGHGRGVRAVNAAAFAAGWAALVIALMSPLDALADVLFSAHMLQHELLMVVAAPLMAAGAPVVAFAWLLTAARAQPIAAAIRRSTARPWAVVSAPATVWLLHGAALWVWHLPSLYEAALADGRVHALQHLSFFGTAVLFWWGIAHGRYGRLGYGAAVLYVFTTAMHSGVLGALLTLAPSPWYPAYAHTLAGAGLTPLEDQQLAGLIMWVPAGLIFTGAGLGFFAAWVRSSDRASRFAPARHGSGTASPGCGALRASMAGRVRLQLDPGCRPPSTAAANVRPRAGAPVRALARRPRPEPPVR
jgi:putative membrane protein